MRREFSPIVISIITLLLLVFLAWGSVQAMRRLPSNYISRLPASVQKLLIPEPQSSFLPPAPVPIGSEDDFQTEVSAIPTPTLIPQEAIPTKTTVSIDEVEPTRPVETEASETIIDAFASTVSESEDLPPIPEFHRIGDLTYHKQDWNNCGPATLAMGLSALGLEVTQYDTAAYLKPSYEDRNVTPQEMVEYVNTRTELRALNRVNGNIDTLKRLLANDFPIILEVGDRAPSEVAWLDSEPGVAYRDWWGHYLLAAGYDDSLDELWVFDSLIWDVATEEENTPDGHPYSYEDLLTFWPQFNGSYIILYPQEREQEVAAILGAEFDMISMWQSALERNQNALTEQPDNAFLWFNLGTAFNSLGRHEEAASAFDKARTVGLPWRMLWYQFGPYEAYFNTGQYQQIILLANATLTSRPFFEESFFWRGKAQEALGDVVNARQDFQSAIDFNPNYLPAVDAMAALDS